MNSPDKQRFLRSPESRAALFYGAEGLCQGCGAELKTGWHSDHIIPYSVIQRTNVYEMQALCPTCNTSKGNKMMADLIDPTKLRLRTGQRLAIQTLVNRVRAGHEGNSHTAIVLPTRYGKTDVMRIAGMMLMPTHISRALILVPNNYLRAQVVDRRKWEKSLNFYNLPAPPLGIPVGEADKPPTPPFPKENLQFVSMTMQMAQRYVGILRQWVDSEKMRFQVPPLVFVDEAHTGSMENQWGQAVNELAEAGAFVCLLTATPFRTDNEHIPGFELELMNTTDVLRRRRSTSDPEGWDIFEGRQRIYVLKPHHATTFREAWAESNPPVLCDITRRPFDIVVEEIDPFTGELKKMGRLSKLSASQSRKVLDRELRKPHIIKQACKILVQILALRHRDERETAAIVFVGNDKPSDNLDNKHAWDVKRAISALSPKLRVEIATSSTQKADKTIEKFVQKTDIDVLIVKQMAGLGVDSERLKVCLDLSNVRTLNAFIQRVTRIATVWDRRSITGRDTDIVYNADYITPDDIVGLETYNYFIRDQGGGVTDESLEYKGTVRDGSGAVEWIPPDEIVAKDLILPEEVQDSKLQTSQGSTLEITDGLYALIPMLTKTHTQPDVAKLIPDLRRLVGAEPPAEAVEMPAASPDIAQPKVRNVNEEKAALRKEVDSLSKRITRLIMGRNFQRGGDQEYIDMLKVVKQRHRERVGIPWEDGRGLDIATLDELANMRDNMKRELAGLKERNGA